MNYKLAFVYNLLRIFSQPKKRQPSEIIKKIENSYCLDRKEDPKLFNKSPNKYKYPMGQK